MDASHHDLLLFRVRVAKRADVLIVYELATASVSRIIAAGEGPSDLEYNLQRIIDMGRGALPKHEGGPGENMVYLTPAMYDALQKAIEQIKGKK